MKKILFYFMLISLIPLPKVSEAQVMTDYTCYPVFTANNVKPNILILLDNSGSMNQMAYGYDDEGYYYPNDFNPSVTYYGYFKPTAKYTYGVNEFDMNPAGTWNGNFLNWLTMRRVDIMRKVLVGGKATSRTGGGNTKLYGEVPAQVSRKYFKFYSSSENYSPYNGNYVFKISKGKIEVYSITTPANFNHAANFKMYCNPFNGHDAIFDDMVFWYTGGINQDNRSYNVYPRKASEPSGACDYNKYDTANRLTTFTYVTSFVVKVDKQEAEEPEDFDADGNIAGILQRIDEKARFGLEYFNNDGSKFELGGGVNDGGKISKYIGGNLTSMITNIENEACTNWTPLAEAFYEGVNYYRQVAPYYSTGDYAVNQNNDPFYYQDLSQYVTCGNNFILIITDGASTMDLNIPAWLRDYDGDGRDPGSYADSGSDYLDDVALWANTTDLRADLDGSNNVITYGVFAFGAELQLLKDAAKNGGFIDRNGNNRPDLDVEWDDNGDGVPDTYFEAPNGYELESQILSAITAMLQQAASGTAASLLSTSSESEGSLFQAYFRPQVFDNMRQIKWVGYINALWVDPYGNIREDTDHDNALVYDEDKIIRFDIDSVTGDTAIKRYHDSDGNGKADIVPPATEPVPYETAPLEEMESQWEAGKILAQRNAATRNIKTWVDTNGNSIVDGGEVIDFVPANAGKLRPFLDVDTDTEAENIINFIRGEVVAGYRDRNITIGGTEYVWKLGDIVYSTPTVVGKPMEMYNLYYSDITYAEFYSQWKNRGVTVYAGANDGMLHAFKAGTFYEGDNEDTSTKVEHGWYSAAEDPVTPGDLGSERWAFIPFNLLPHLKWLADPDYTHVYYVDLKPKVTDVRIFNDDANHPNGWGTILIGGMRLGGGTYSFSEDFDDDGAVEADEGNPGGKTNPWIFRSAYFVLDITVPSNPVFLGEFTDPNLAFTTAYPAISRLEANSGFQNPEDDEWYAIVGSGPTDCDGTSDQNGYAFVFDLTTLQLAQKTVTSESNAFMAEPITLDINLDYNTDLIYIGETCNGTAGKMYRISTRGNPDPAVFSYKYNPAINPWLLTTLFSSTGPITASPTASLDEDENVWVYFGTGKFFSEADKSDVTQQYFYGIKEPCPWGGCDPATDEVHLADLYNSTNITVLTNKEVVGATATTWDTFVDEVQAKDGWYITLATGGERVLNRPSVLGGVVLTAPFTPDDDICSFGGTGALYAFYYETGSAYYKPILGTETYGDDEKSIVRVELDKGITSEIGLHVGKKATSTGFIQQGSGEIIQVEVDPALKIKSGIVGWKQH